MFWKPKLSMAVGEPQSCYFSVLIAEGVRYSPLEWDSQATLRAKARGVVKGVRKRGSQTE